MSTPWLEECRSSMSKPQCGMHAVREKGDPKRKMRKRRRWETKVLTCPYRMWSPLETEFLTFFFCTPAALPGKMLQSTSPWFYLQPGARISFSSLFWFGSLSFVSSWNEGSWSQIDQEWNSSFTALSVALVKILYSLSLSFPICKIWRLKPTPWGC